MQVPLKAKVISCSTNKVELSRGAMGIGTMDDNSQDEETTEAADEICRHQRCLSCGMMECIARYCRGRPKGKDQDKEG